MFAEKYNKQGSTIKKKYKTIPGHSFENRELIFEDWSRYPDPNAHKCIRMDAKYREILVACNSEYYIDADMLHLTEGTFCKMLESLVTEGLLQHNEFDCGFGANDYMVTHNGAELAKMERLDAYKQIATVTGTFAGAASSQMMN